MAKKKIVLCDTNILIDAYRGKTNALKFLQRHQGLAAISAITAMELFQGCKSQQEYKIIKTQLKAYTIVFADKIIMDKALHLSMAYFQKSLMVADAIIAATAIVSGYELATYNLKDFTYIKGLKLLK